MVDIDSNTPSALEVLVPPDPARLFYTIRETAVVLNMSTKSVRRLIGRGCLTPSKALRKKLIPRRQVEAFEETTC